MYSGQNQSNISIRVKEKNYYSNGFFNDNNIRETSNLNYVKENKKEDYVRIRNRDTGHIKHVTRDRYNKYKEEKKNRKNTNLNKLQKK